MELDSEFKKTVLAVAAMLSLTHNRVCYKKHDIGCFSNRRPFNNARGMLPESPDKIGLELRLYTRAHTNIYNVLSSNSKDFHYSHYDGTKKTKLIIHGYRDDGRSDWMMDLKNAILKHEDVNVVIVDWEKGADRKDYSQAAANTRVVGALTANIIRTMKSYGKARYRDIHIIGHSLGAQIAGYIGERISGLGRISGLDPAGPRFHKKNKKVRLDPSDAKYVDIIHTDGEPTWLLGFGYGSICGDVDFYPNTGKNQPGCRSTKSHMFSLIVGKIKKFTTGIACSHVRAREFFIESVNKPKCFKSYPCKSAKDFENGKCKCKGNCGRMGYHADKSRAKGEQYLSTKKNAPYCR